MFQSILLSFAVFTSLMTASIAQENKFPKEIPAVPQEGFSSVKELEDFYFLFDDSWVTVNKFEIRGQTYYGCTRYAGNVAEEAAIFVEETPERLIPLIVTWFAGANH